MSTTTSIAISNTVEAILAHKPAVTSVLFTGAPPALIMPVSTPCRNITVPGAPWEISVGVAVPAPPAEVVVGVAETEVVVGSACILVTHSTRRYLSRQGRITD